MLFIILSSFSTFSMPRLLKSIFELIFDYQQQASFDFVALIPTFSFLDQPLL